MGNEGIYSVDKDLVKQNITFCQTKSFVGPLWVGPTHEIVTKNPAWHDSSPSCHVLYTWLFSWVSFSRDSHEPVTKSTCSTFETWFFTDLSHSSLTINHIYIQGKWLKKLQLNLVQNKSQHNVVGNHNFTYWYVSNLLEV